MPRFNTAKQVEIAAAGVQGFTHLDLYAGDPPESGDEGAASNPLATISGIAWDQSANPAVLANEPSASAQADGEARWGRFRDAGDNIRMDTMVGGGITVSVDGEPNAVIIEGARVALVSAQLSQSPGDIQS